MLNLCRNHAELVQTLCRIYADITPKSFRNHVELVQKSCRTHAEIMLKLCSNHVEILTSACINCINYAEITPRPGRNLGFSTSPRLGSENRLTTWARHASARRRRAAAERSPRRVRCWGERGGRDEGRDTGRTAEGATIPHVVVAPVEGVGTFIAEAIVEAVRPQSKGALDRRRGLQTGR